MHLSWKYIYQIVLLIGSLWSPVDWVTDCITLDLYYKMCQAEKLDCLFWQMGVVFLILPTIFATAFFTVLKLQGKADRKDVILFGLLYVLYIPYRGITNHAKAVFCPGDGSLDEKDLPNDAALKLFEVVGEALPQVRSIDFSTEFRIRYSLFN